MLGALPLLGLASVAAPVVAERVWLERLALLLPAAGPTRWLLLADAACLAALGLRARRRWLGVGVAIGGGFLGLSGLGILLSDFYLGLAVFHLVAATTALLALPRARWIGAASLALALALGALT